MTEILENFTPGPWKVDHCEHVTGFCVKDEDGQLVALPCTATRPRKGEPLYNAYLIAAAPDMYWLLGDLRAFFLYGPERETERGKYLLKRITEQLKKARREI